MSEVAPPESPVPLWSVNEVAAYYREDPRTTRRRIHRGELNAVILPGSRKLLIRSDEFPLWRVGSDDDGPLRSLPDGRGGPDQRW